MDDHLVIRGKLSRFVEDLKEQTFPTSTISIELSQFVASAMENYLNGKSKSLDAAFGLKPKRGAPGYRQLKKDTAKLILKLELEGKSRKEIANEITRYDERALRRIWKEHQVEAIAEEVVKSINEREKTRGVLAMKK